MSQSSLTASFKPRLRQIFLAPQAQSDHQVQPDDRAELEDRAELDDQAKLDLFDQVLAQSVPQVIEQNTDYLTQGTGVSSAKETLVSNQIAENISDASYLEVETTPEINPEVSEFLQRVEDHQEQAPKEVVIKDDGSLANLPANLPTTKVVVVPITPELEKKARFKGPKFSLRWLVEWSHKIIKMFTGRVIYQPAET